MAVADRTGGYARDPRDRMGPVSLGGAIFVLWGGDDACTPTAGRRALAPPPLACPMARRDTTHNPYLHSHDWRSACAAGNCGSDRERYMLRAFLKGGRRGPLGLGHPGPRHMFGRCQSTTGLTLSRRSA